MRRKNNKTFILIVIIVLGIVVYKYRSFHNNPSQDSLPTPVNIDGKDIKTKDIHDTSAKYLDITATYPTSGVGASYVEEKVREQIDIFKKDNDFTDTSAEDISNMNLDKDREYTMNINYSTSHNDKFLTHRIDIYNFTGGAHGGNIVQTYTFDSFGKMVEVSDLFSNPTTGLQTLASKVVAKIKSDPNYKDAISAEWFGDGTAPTADNYSAFMIDGANIKVIFQQYQIAAYVYGNIEVSLPLSELASVLKAEYK
jgi:hypothetical protein